MALQEGTRLGAYEVMSPLGAGGMGEVYRARDTKLNRDVALKVLPEAFAANPERMARFEREAQVLASLNHPNIAAIYGLEESGSVRALVMELVEGATLAEPIARTQLLVRPASGGTAAPGTVIPAQAGIQHGTAVDPRLRGGDAKGRGAMALDDALPTARQIADALEYAHERGIVHRDLKPANVKITPEGAVKVLDFGLAKAVEDPRTSSAADIHNSPTLSTAATQAGMILGTAAYMSPEQARGKAVDRRADIWAFGCVLYEMLTGKKAFDGETVSDVLSAVIKDEPDWSQLPSDTPAHIRVLLQRCLTKDPKQRLRDMGDARISLDEVLSGAAQEQMASAGLVPSVWRRILPWAAGVIAGAVVAGLVVWRILASSPAQSPVLAYIPPPPATTFRSFGFGAGPVVVSPDGKQLAFSATDENGVTRLYVRPLASEKARAIAQTEDAAGPFWSPDGRSLGFFADGKLKTVNLDNGSIQVLADASCVRSTGAWNASGTILYSPHCNAPLDEIPSSGGSTKPATKLGDGAFGHRAPAFLPDGRRFLFESDTENSSSIRMGSLDSSRQELVLRNASSPGFSSGELLFVRNHHTFAQPMNPRTSKLAGEAAVLADARNFSVSSGAALAYQGGTPEGRLEWYDRSGNPLGSVGPVATYDAVRISPDGKHVLADVEDTQANSSDLWSYPASGGVGTRLTFGPGWKGYPVSSPDGKYIVYGCLANGKRGICRKPANGSGAEETLFTIGSVGIAAAIDWSPDGRYLSVAEYFEPSYRFENVVFPLVGDRRAFRPAPIKANQYDGMFSPDGRWLAYFSYETGRPEVYVVPFPGPGGKFQISQNGGWTCKWDREGNLYFLTMGDRLMEANLGFSGGAVQVKAIHPLFQLSLPSFSNPFFDVSADGSRFIVVTSADPNAARSITVLLNWKSKLGG